MDGEQSFIFKSETHTLPETNVPDQNPWLEDEFPFGKAFGQVPD